MILVMTALFVAGRLPAPPMVGVVDPVVVGVWTPVGAFAGCVLGMMVTGSGGRAVAVEMGLFEEMMRRREKEHDRCP